MILPQGTTRVFTANGKTLAVDNHGNVILLK